MLIKKVYIFSGEEIHRMRKKMNLNQTEFSKLIGISFSMISLIETSQRNLTTEKSEKLANMIKEHFNFDALRDNEEDFFRRITQ